jgi:hypothetical protein
MRSRDDRRSPREGQTHAPLTPGLVRRCSRHRVAWLVEEPAGPRTPAGKTIEVHHVPASASLSARGRTGSPGGPHRGVSSRTGMEPALQRRRGVRGHRRPASRWPEHLAAPAGPPQGDRPSAPAVTAGDSRRRGRGELTCARSSSARGKDHHRRPAGPAGPVRAARSAAVGWPMVSALPAAGRPHVDNVTASCGEHPPPSRETQVRASRQGTRQKGPPMRQIRISKRQRPARWRPEPLPPDPRDPDIVRAKQLARRARPPQR